MKTPLGMLYHSVQHWYIVWLQVTDFLVFPAWSGAQYEEIWNSVFAAESFFTIQIKAQIHNK